MGRPVKIIKKDKRVTLRFEPAMFERLRKVAASKGMTLSLYLRKEIAKILQE